MSTADLPDIVPGTPADTVPPRVFRPRVELPLLRASRLVIGKLISALSYVLLLLLAAIPLQSLAFLFGGVTEAEIVLAFVILLVTAVALGSVGIYCSAIMQRTLSASVVTYGF